MIGSFNNIKIQGICSAVPSYVEENEKYASTIGGSRVKKQIKITGVKKRHVSGKHQRPSDLCYAATERLIKKLNWDKNEIRILIFITQSPNYLHPSTAFFLHKRLELSKDCLVYDMNLGCSSFNVGMQTISSLMQSCKTGEKALLLLGDVAGMIRNPEAPLKPDEITHDMLFGTAGAAIAVEKVEKNDLLFMNCSDGTGYDAIIGHYNQPPQMNGPAVFSFAINDVTDSILEFKNIFQLTDEHIDYYVFHQAQKLILDTIAEACEIPPEKELRSLENYGNTSGTSVPLSICANHDLLSQNDTVKLLLCGFGVGLSWGCIYTEIDCKNVLPVIVTDEHYDEDKKPAKGLQDKNILVLDADSAMGEWLSRYDNDKSAHVILCGSDKEKMKSIQNDLFMKSDLCYTSKELTRKDIDTLISFCVDKEYKIDGIVIPFSMQKELICYLIEQLKSFNDEQTTSVVLIETSENEQNLQDIKQEITLKIQNLSVRSTNKNIRINGIVYNKHHMDIVPIDGEGIEWINIYLQKDCPVDMKKPFYLANMQQYLLSDNAEYLTENVIYVD